MSVELIVKSSPPRWGIKTVFEVGGRALALRYKIRDLSVFVMGIYAPANASHRPNFFIELNEQVAKNPVNCDLILCLGDFNVVQNPEKDHSSFTSRAREAGAEKFASTTDLLALKDVYRQNYISGRDFSHFAKRFKTQSRIDRIYTNQALADCIKDMGFRTVSFSDHKIVSAIFSTEPFYEPRRPSYWKLNTSILSDDLVQTSVRDLIKDTNLFKKMGMIF